MTEYMIEQIVKDFLADTNISQRKYKPQVVPAECLIGQPRNKSGRPRIHPVEVRIPCEHFTGDHERCALAATGVNEKPACVHHMKRPRLTAW